VAAEDRDVATVDILGAFLQADMDETVHVRFDGKMANLMSHIDPKLYRKFILNEHKKPVLYVKLRTLRAALLFWTKLTQIIREMGFTINPYDECVANKKINNSTCTIIWHVDDLKITHKDTGVVSDIIKNPSMVFGKEAPLSINRGKCHNYLGMTLDVSCSGKLAITMKDYINNIIDNLPDDMTGTTSTPAANHLFEVNDLNPEHLTEENSVKFHRYAAKLLFLCKRARPDIHTAVAFLSTCVKKPDYDDNKKLSRVMKYLQETKDLNLTLEAKNVSKINWWVDASYAIHHDM
jgi:Reverse transcriptase (RNA-dependent DNA polymerase)